MVPSQKGLHPYSCSPSQGTTLLLINHALLVGSFYFFFPCLTLGIISQVEFLLSATYVVFVIIMLRDELKSNNIFITK